MTDSIAPTGPAPSEAPAPAPSPAPAPAPSEPNAADAPQPVRNDPIPAEPKEPKEDKPPSTRDALKKAAAKVEEDAKAERQAAKPAEPAQKPAEPAKPAQAPTEAKAPEAAPAAPPAPKPPTPAPDAPTRFNPEAKTAWANTPEPVKAETQRAFKELEGGIEQYRSFVEPLKPFIQAAQTHGTDLPSTLKLMSEIETAIVNRGPEAGFQIIADRMGFSLRDVAARIAGQPIDDVSRAQDNTIAELKSTVQQLQQQLGGIQQGFAGQQQQAVISSVTRFAESKPRFDELSADIAFFIESGRTTDLDEAYTLAERLNPAPAGASSAPVASSAPAVDPAPAVQPAKDAPSIRGAPASGSDPVDTTPSSSIRDAIKKAAARSGR